MVGPLAVHAAPLQTESNRDSGARIGSGPMRVIFTGSRKWADVPMVDAIVKSLHADDVVIHGGCGGLDTIVDVLAKARGLTVEVHLAKWTVHGADAGPIRNSAMLATGADRCIAFPLPDSKGTWDMVRKCKEAGVPVTICEVLAMSQETPAFRVGVAWADREHRSGRRGKWSAFYGAERVLLTAGLASTSSALAEVRTVATTRWEELNARPVKR